MFAEGEGAAKAGRGVAERTSPVRSQIETLTRPHPPEEAGKAAWPTEAAGRRPLMVLDRMVLRRAGLIGLLTVWAEHHGLAIAEGNPDALADEYDFSPPLVLINAGGWAMESPEVAAWIEGARTRFPDAAIVILSDREEAEEVVAALEAGVRGFIPASSAVTMAFQALTFILCGGSFFPPTALLRSTRSAERETSCRPHDAGPGGLTARQQEVLGLLRQGKSNKLIARALNMQEATVKVHVRQIMRKLGVSNRTQAALLASNDRGDSQIQFFSASSHNH